VFLAHFGVAFAAKRLVPEASLGTLFVAAQLADLVWPNLVLAGVEEVAIEPGATAVTPLDFVHYPWSHGLVELGLLGALLGLAWSRLSRARLRGAVVPLVPLVMWALVVSHWLLDALSHRPDVPLGWPGAPRVGLGLWSSLPGTLAAELGALGLGVALYLRATRARDRVGRLALGGLVAFLAAVYLASVFGPPPPDVRAVAWSAQAMWLLVAWAAWVDRHRRATDAAA